MGISRLIIETDATMVRDALEGSDYRLSAMGDVVTEIKYLLASEFASVSLKVCPRNCNQVAHALAALGCTPSVLVLEVI